MDRLYKCALQKKNIYLYFPESFEWLILNSGLIQGKDIRVILDNPKDFLDSREYFSWERFFTKLLVERTKDSYIDSGEHNIQSVMLLMLSWAVMISLCHADMRLPGYLSWNVSFDGADRSAPSRKELVHTSMLCQHFKRRDDGTGICLFHSAVMPEAFLIPEEICQ